MTKISQNGGFSTDSGIFFHREGPMYERPILN